MKSETTGQDACSFTGRKLGYQHTEPVASAQATHVVFTKRAS